MQKVNSTLSHEQEAFFKTCFAYASVLVGLKIDSPLGLTKTVFIGTAAFLVTYHAHGVRKSCKYYPQRKANRVMIPDLVQTQSWRYKTTIVIHKTPHKIKK